MSPTWGGPHGTRTQSDVVRFAMANRARQYEVILRALRRRSMSNADESTVSLVAREFPLPPTDDEERWLLDDSETWLDLFNWAIAVQRAEQSRATKPHKIVHQRRPDVPDETTEMDTQPLIHGPEDEMMDAEDDGTPPMTPFSDEIIIDDMAGVDAEAAMALEPKAGHITMQHTARSKETNLVTAVPRDDGNFDEDEALTEVGDSEVDDEDDDSYIYPEDQYNDSTTSSDQYSQYGARCIQAQPDLDLKWLARIKRLMNHKATELDNEDLVQGCRLFIDACRKCADDCCNCFLSAAISWPTNEGEAFHIRYTLVVAHHVMMCCVLPEFRHMLPFVQVEGPSLLYLQRYINQVDVWLGHYRENEYRQKQRERQRNFARRAWIREQVEAGTLNWEAPPSRLREVISVDEPWPECDVDITWSEVDDLPTPPKSFVGDFDDTAWYTDDDGSLVMDDGWESQTDWHEEGQDEMSNAAPMDGIEGFWYSDNDLGEPPFSQDPPPQALPQSGAHEGETGPRETSAVGGSNLIPVRSRLQAESLDHHEARHAQRDAEEVCNNLDFLELDRLARRDRSPSRLGPGRGGV